MDWEPVSTIASALGIKPTDRIVVVRIGASTLQLYLNRILQKAYAISTSRLPPSNTKGSLGTPRGLHEIAERIGAGQPPGMVFKFRVPTGQHYHEWPNAEADLITSRILWLRGLEPGVNRGGDVDTYARCVYIHGTQNEDRIGEPVSSGCIRMRNGDVVELYEQVRAGDWVWIAD